MDLGKYSIDLTDLFVAFDKAGEKDAQLRATVKQSSDVIRGAYTAAAQGVVEYNNKLTAAVAEQNAAKTVINEQIALLRQLKQTEKDLNAERKGASSTEVQRITAELARNQAEQRKITTAIQESRIAYQQEQAAVASIRSEIKQQGNDQKLATAAVRDTALAEKQAADAAKQRAAEEKKAVEAAEKAARAAGLLTQLEQRLTDLVERRAKATSRSEVQGYNKQIAGIKQELSDLTKDADPAEGGLMGSLLGKIGPLAAGLVTIDKLLGTIRQGLQDYAQLDSIEKTFKALTGSAAAGAQEVAFLREQSNRLGLDLVPTAQAYAGLYASAKEANISIATTRDLFTSLTTAGRVLGKSQAEIESAVRAVEQMLSKGTVSSQELKLQLGNALPGAFSLAAKAAGVTTQELGKMLERGQILARDFLPKFAAELKRAYGAGGEDAANSTQANLGRIEAAYKNFSARIGAFFAPALAVFAKVVSAQETAAQKSERLVAEYDKQAQGVRQLQDTVTPLLKRYEQLSTSTTRNAADQQELKKVIEQIGETVPTAVTQFNEYGKALAINGKVVQEFIKNEENLARYNNRARLAENSQALRELVAEQEQLQRTLQRTETIAGTGQRRLAKGATQGGEILYFSPQETEQIIRDTTAKLAQVQDYIRGNLENRQRLRGKSPLLPTGDDAANDQAIQGLIEKQQKLIDTLKERQKAAAQENQGNGKDFLFGKDGLNEQLEAAQKELDRLLGKIDKSATAAENKLLAALRVLKTKELALQKEYNQALLKDLQDQGREKAAEQLKQDLAAIQRLEQAIIDQEAVVKNLGGKGAKADGQLSPEQQAEVDRLSVQAYADYLAAISQLDRETSAKLLDLQRESDQKELGQLAAKFDEELRIARDAHNDQLVEALEAAKKRELVALQARQALAKIDQQEALTKQNLENDPTVPTLRTFDVTSDQSGGPEVEGAAKRNKLLEFFARTQVDLEKEKQKQILENEIKANNARLQVIESSFSDEDIARRKSLEDANAAAYDALNKLNASKPKFDLLNLLGVAPEDRDEVQSAFSAFVSTTVSQLQQLTQAQIASAQAVIDAKNQQISETQNALTQELAYNKEGSASSIQTLREQLADEKAQRRAAIQEKKKAAKEQLLIDTATQGSALITSSAQVLEGFSKIPVVGFGLGLAAIAVMIAGFVAAKGKALQAINKSDQGFFKGGFTGSGNPREESQTLGKKPYTYHKGEFVFPADQTQDLRHVLFEPLHQRRPMDIRWDSPQIQKLLPDYTLPRRMRAEQQKAAKLQVTHQFEPLQAKFDGLEKKLGAIEKHVATTANRFEVVPIEGGVLIYDPVTKSTYIQKVEGL